MNKIFGLDLGQNSISWAMVEEDKKIKASIKICYSKEMKHAEYKTYFQHQFEKIKLLSKIKR